MIQDYEDIHSCHHWPDTTYFSKASSDIFLFFFLLKFVRNFSFFLVESSTIFVSIFEKSLRIPRQFPEFIHTKNWEFAFVASRNAFVPPNYTNEQHCILCNAPNSLLRTACMQKQNEIWATIKSEFVIHSERDLGATHMIHEMNFLFLVMRELRSCFYFQSRTRAWKLYRKSKKVAGPIV